jgi:hypothetical protein
VSPVRRVSLGHLFASAPVLRIGTVVAGWCVIALVTGGALVTGSGRASPSAFELVMNDGFHTLAEPADRFTLGFRHEGPFTSSAPFCASGYAVDVTLVPPIEERQFTCGDGSGTITARKTIVQADALFTHEEGTWSIVEGTGHYTILRGRGTSVLDTVSGDPVQHLTTRYNERWSGVIDFDATRPVLSISQASGRRLTRPAGAYNIRIAFTSRDQSSVSYDLTLSGSGVFVHRAGPAASGKVSMAFRVRPRKSARTLRLTLSVQDPVGNETKTVRRLRLSS